MRYRFILLLPALLLFSCKKPKEGYWKATFTDDTGAAKAIYLRIQKNQKGFINIIEETPKSTFNGMLLVTDNTIMSGSANYWGFDGVGNSFNYNYTHVWGEIERKVMKGTYDYKKREYSSYTMPTPVDTTITIGREHSKYNGCREKIQANSHKL